MLEWTGALCIDTLGILCGYESPIAIVFLVDDESRNSVMICSANTFSITLRDYGGILVDASIPLFWYT